MASPQHLPASRTRRYWAFAIDQTLLLLVTILIFIIVGMTYSDQIKSLLEVVAASPLLTDATQTAATTSQYLDTLVASESFRDALRTLAYPYATALGLSTLFSALYYIIPTKKTGMTLGKKLLRIKVVNIASDTPPDIEQSSIRYFTFLGIGTFSGIVSILDLLVNRTFIPSNPAVNILELFLSQITYIISIAVIVMIVARPDRRGIHDILARTVVVSTVQSENERSGEATHQSAS